MHGKYPQKSHAYPKKKGCLGNVAPAATSQLSPHQGMYGKKQHMYHTKSYQGPQPVVLPQYQAPASYHDFSYQPYTVDKQAWIMGQKPSANRIAHGYAYQGPPGSEVQSILQPKQSAWPKKLSYNFLASSPVSFNPYQNRVGTLTFPGQGISVASAADLSQPSKTIFINPIEGTPRRAIPLLKVPQRDGIGERASLRNTVLPGPVRLEGLNH